MLQPHVPPHTLHGTPPRFSASACVIEMQFFVHRFAHWQLGQWYFRDSVLNETVSDERAATSGGSAIKAAAASASSVARKARLVGTRAVYTRSP